MAASVAYYGQQQTKLMTIKPLYLSRYCSPTFIYLVARGRFSSDDIEEAFVISFVTKMLLLSLQAFVIHLSAITHPNYFCNFVSAKV